MTTDRPIPGPRRPVPSPTPGPRRRPTALSTEALPPTSPYTHVPFGPTISAAHLWAHDQVDADPTASFDQVVPGTVRGYAELTLTALSPVFFGDADRTTESFRWPATDGHPRRYGIPGTGIRGCLRGGVEALLGSALGLSESDDLRPAIRNPVSDNDHPLTAVARNSYTGLRNPGIDPRDRAATAQPGKQRVGLLTKTEAGLVVRECPQFLISARPTHRRPNPPKNNIRKVPTIRWAVVRDDLLATHAAGIDARVWLQERLGETVHVVWAQVTVGGIPRPAAVGIGLTAAEAEHNAATRHDRSGMGVVAPGRCVFQHFLDDTWEPTHAPRAWEMVFFPTNMSNLTREGRPTGNAANCYLLEVPGGFLAADGGVFYNPPVIDLVVTEHAVHEFTAMLTTRRYWKPVLDRRRPWEAEGGWPVFFDTDSRNQVTHLGASGGFPVWSPNTVKDSVENAGGRWTRTLHAAGADNDAVDALFGAIDDTHRIHGRLDVGHGTATTEITALPAESVALLGAHLESAATRLQNRNGSKGQNQSGSKELISYANTAPAARGRQFYWHRGQWEGDGAATWSLHAQAYRTQFDGDETAPTDDTATSMAPLPIGSTFTSRIPFANLTPTELGAVLFVLLFPAAPASDPAGPAAFAHKLGGGKPLGLGSMQVEASVHVLSPRRHADLDDPGDEVVDPAGFIEVFLAAARWRIEDEKDATDEWVYVAETGRRWPPHVAAWLMVHRWEHRPAPDATAPCGPSAFRSKLPMLDVFEIAKQST
ncbi:RAMP superfamily CRISPR-associated protein [Rhodococcus sp. YH1]|uniref:RAMP superfamily CRISPR-associated protein n=1 Tax=Rhodococcus sp. YH1 TaxID=89066 RepID=UPI0013874368|nr:hypothetical protein [Rhodococcus sp. YH1]